MQRWRAVFLALTIFIFLTGGFFYAWSADVPWIHSDGALVLISFGAIIFLTLFVYQSIGTGAAVHSLATNMVQDMAMYSRELFSELYRNSPVPYVLIDGREQVTSLNAAALRLFMVKEGQLDGTNIFDRIVEPEESNSGKRDLLPEYFKQGIPINDVELCIQRSDNELRWVRLSLFSFRDATRSQRGLITFVDITKQKEIDRAKTEFVSLASHQLRTPISALKWNLELLKQIRGTEIPEMEQMYIDKIERGVTRMELLISDFLSVSRLELGTLTPTYGDIPLGQLLDSILEEHEKQAASRTITLERDWGNEAARVLHTDARLLTMAIGNLISNAVKYTPDGGIVRVHVHAEEGNLILTVSDTGIGIPEEDQEHIFSKIFRASNTKDHEGTGLGLYIVREILHVLGGSITFISTVNVGTTFTVVLPVNT